MAASGCYISPINPQGYHRNSIFGKFHPSHSQRPTVPYKRTFSVKPAQTNSIAKYPIQNRQSRSLPLPPLHVTKLPQVVKKTKNDRGTRSSDEKYGNWWELPKKPYKVKLTKFEKKRSRYSGYKHQFKLSNLENNSQMAVSRNQEAHNKGMVVPSHSQENSGTSSVAGNNSSIFPSYQPECNLHKSWTYSRSRSGLRRTHTQPPLAQQLFTSDLDYSPYNKEISFCQNESSSSYSKLKSESLCGNEKKSGITMQQMNSHRPILPKIVIDLEGAILKSPPIEPIKLYKAEISRYLRLLEQTCEWIKIMQATISPNSSIIAPVSKLTVVNLNAFASLPGSMDAERNHAQTTHKKNAQQPRDKASKLSLSTWPNDQYLSSSVKEFSCSRFHPSVWNKAVSSSLLVAENAKTCHKELQYQDKATKTPTFICSDSLLLSQSLNHCSLPETPYTGESLQVPETHHDQSMHVPSENLQHNNEVTDNNPLSSTSEHNHFPVWQPQKGANGIDSHYPSMHRNVSRCHTDDKVRNKSTYSWPENKLNFDSPCSQSVNNPQKLLHLIKKKTQERFERTKPILRNRYPDLRIFGHQIQHLLDIDVTLSEESKRQLVTAVESGECDKLI